MVVITYLAQDENSPQPLPFGHVRLCVTGFLEPPASNSVVLVRFIYYSSPRIPISKLVPIVMSYF